MAWIKEEHAGAVAVLFTWLVALSPWAVTWFRPTGVTAIAVRFLPVRVLYIFGAQIPGERPFVPAWQVADFQVESEVILAGHLGTAALAVGLVAVGASVVYYAREDSFAAALPLHPVRLFGVLHALLAVLLLAATVLFFLFHSGPTIPIGGALAAVFAYLLLTVELAGDDDDGEGDEGPTSSDGDGDLANGMNSETARR